MSIKTESEEAFESYLKASDLSHDRIRESSGKRADYRLQHGKTDCVFEVKEFDDPPLANRIGAHPLAPPIRNKISRAAKQFREHRDCCCSLVLWNSKSIYRSVQPIVVLSAAFGQISKVPEPYSVEPPTYLFSGSAVLNKTSNTTISAIVVLTKYVLNRLW